MVKFNNNFKSITLAVIFLVNNLFAEEYNKDGYLQILAKSISTNNNIITANGDIVVYSPSYYITANKLIYDKNSSNIEMYEDVTINNNNNLISFSQYVKNDLVNDNSILEPMLLFDSKTNLWMNSKKAKKDKEYYNLDDSTLSSCECKDPAWSISFTSGDYNTTNQWINTYNTRLYVNNIPILYTPYFGFPTDKTRRTGLLRPTIGYAKDEGLIYAQPIYFAPKSNYDFEYVPQVKEQRGYGDQLFYRYVDSQYSKLLIDGGFFYENEKYVKENLLENDKHYGWNLNYSRKKLFSNKKSEDGLLIDFKDMSDVDYINTKYNSDNSSYTNKFLESVVRYFYNNNKYITSIETKLNNDLSKNTNDETLQQLPQLTIHKYATDIFTKELTYKFNIDYINRVRNKGIEAEITSLDIPISYSDSFLYDYVNFSLVEQVNLTNIKYNNNDEETNFNLNDATYGENNTVISLWTDMLKQYDYFSHNVNLSTSFSYSNQYINKGDIYGIKNEDTQENIQSLLEPFSISQSQKKIFSTTFKQSFYDKNLKERLKHQIKQSYLYDEEHDKYSKLDLEHNLNIYFDNFNIYNRTFYNHEIKKIKDSATTLEYKYDDYFANIYYFYKKNIINYNTQEDLKYKLGFKFARHYRLSYAQEEDITNNINKKKEIIFDIDKKCWGINFKLVDSLIATNTIDDSISRQNILYVEINFKQLFKFDQKHKF